MPEFTLFNIAGLAAGFMFVGVMIGIVWELIKPSTAKADSKKPVPNQQKTNSQPPQTTAAQIKSSVNAKRN